MTNPEPQHDPLADIPGDTGLVARSLADLISVTRSQSLRLAVIEAQLDQLARQQPPTMMAYTVTACTAGVCSLCPGTGCESPTCRRPA